MAKRRIIRITLGGILLFAFMAFFVCSYLKLYQIEEHKDINLYSLVPNTSVGAFETDDVYALMQHINQLSSKRDGVDFRFSKIFKDISDNFDSYLSVNPHGLSPHLNKMLVSFHQPIDSLNQVVYLKLDNEHLSHLKNYIVEHLIAPFSVKKEKYKQETIYVYPIDDDMFLSCYMGDGFFVMSYQMRLIKEVIDVHHDKALSLLRDKSFAKVYDRKNKYTSLELYFKLNSVPLGHTSDSIQASINLGGWAQYDVKLDPDMLYFTGYVQPKHKSKLGLLARQEEFCDSLPGNFLPSTTFLFQQYSIHDFAGFTDEFRADSCLSDSSLITEYKYVTKVIEDDLATDLTTFLFYTDTTPDVSAMAVINVNDLSDMKKDLKDFLNQKDGYYHFSFKNVLSRLTGVNIKGEDLLATFFQDKLLICSDKKGLDYYQKELLNQSNLALNPLYQVMQNNISLDYKYVFMADMERTLNEKSQYLRFVPRFFIKNKLFFQHFILAIQLTSSDGVVSPNIVLLYKG